MVIMPYESAAQVVHNEVLENAEEDLQTTPKLSALVDEGDHFRAVTP